VQCEHVIVVALDANHAMIDEIIEKLGIRRRIALRLSHFSALGQVLNATDLIATVPARVAMHHAAVGALTWCTPPVALPTLSVNLLWHARYHKDPGNQWLRGHLAALGDGDEGAEAGAT
jgi:DNA-binding transcriptional LysR family regulator